MGNRKRIGLFFSYDENWIGGSYYIMNLIEALKLLEEEKRPQLTIFFRTSKDVEQVTTLNYKYIDFIQIGAKLSFIKRVTNVIYRKLMGMNFFSLSKWVPYNYFDAIFPTPLKFNTNIAGKIIYWIPDFQDIYFPHLFSPVQLQGRVQWHAAIANTKDTIIFSSHAAESDFKKVYPESSAKRCVLQFAVTHEQYDTLNFDTLREKYSLLPQYFFCPNQFWAHKNQRLVLEAVNKLKNVIGLDIQVAFSGKEYDYRRGDYFAELKKYVADNKLENNVTFLGFIDRKEQLQIMKNAMAVIQPSLFEGWSTVVEDVKSMNQNIIASNIEVHKEQLQEKASYFDPNNVDSLVDAIVNFKKTNIDFAYDKNRLIFANSFINIISK